MGGAAADGAAGQGEAKGETMSEFRARIVNVRQKQSERKWHWQPEELQRLHQYIEDREAGRHFGWGSGKSEIQKIAEEMSRPYFSVFRRIERLRKEMGAKKALRRPRQGELKMPSVSTRLTHSMFEAVRVVAEDRYGSVAAFVRQAIEHELERVG